MGEKFIIYDKSQPGIIGAPMPATDKSENELLNLIPNKYLF